MVRDDEVKWLGSAIFNEIDRRGERDCVMGGCVGRFGFEGEVGGSGALGAGAGCRRGDKGVGVSVTGMAENTLLV